MIKLLHILLESEQTMSAEEVCDYIKRITPNESDVPDYFLNLIMKSNKTFVKKKLSVKQLLKQDSDLRNYVESGEERYGDDQEGEYEPHWEELYNPIVVFNGEVVDGYSRVAAHYNADNDTIYGYVA
jgi:hypothetical protein